MFVNTKNDKETKVDPLLEKNGDKSILDKVSKQGTRWPEYGIIFPPKLPIMATKQILLKNVRFSKIAQKVLLH